MAGLCRLRVAAQPGTRNGIGTVLSRGYGSAAAAQVQYDSDYDYDEYASEPKRDRNGRAMEDSEGSVPGRGVQWVIMGDPVAKKHVFADRLSKLLQVPHISMGSLVRQELHPRSSLYRQIATAVNQGKLVPEEIIFGLLSKRFEEGYSRGETGFILEGIPRTKIQAEILDQLADIDLVVNFKSSEKSLLEQHIRNGIYSPSYEFLNMSKSGLKRNMPLHDNPKSSSANAEVTWKEKLRIYAEQLSKALLEALYDIACSVRSRNGYTGRPPYATGREAMLYLMLTVSPPAVQPALSDLCSSAFWSMSKPLEDYYRQQKKLLDFQVEGAPAETWRGLLAALHLQHMNAVSSSQKLTA